MQTFVAVHNLGTEAVTVRLDVADVAGLELKELLTDDQYAPLENPTDEFRLSGHGFRWLCLDGTGASGR